jgi:SAM-dependent methyltransferase
MEIEEINELTRKAYNKTADKYHANFKNEIEQKEYDRIILDRFSNMLEADALICDAGCGPSGQIGKYLVDKGHQVIGIDISQRCIDIATVYNPQIDFQVMDLMQTSFNDNTFDAIVSFYSIIYTPKKFISKVFAEFNRILKPNGKLLIVVKKGNEEGIIDNEWYEGNKVYFTHFMESEIERYFAHANFSIDFMDTRKPYHFEFHVERIYAIGTRQNVSAQEQVEGLK